MDIKWIGALLIIAGCGSVGFAMASAYRREERALREMVGALDYMQCELQYRLTPLPDLCRVAGSAERGQAGKVLRNLSRELEAQISPDVESCMHAALSTETLPPRLREAFRIMGTSLGHFDVEGQVRGLEEVRVYCRQELEKMAEDRDSRLRSYQTLGLCAGAALAILFV